MCVSYVNGVNGGAECVSQGAKESETVKGMYWKRCTVTVNAMRAIFTVCNFFFGTIQVFVKLQYYSISESRVVQTDTSVCSQWKLSQYHLVLWWEKIVLKENQFGLHDEC